MEFVRRRRRRHPIELTPLIDVVFLLLVFLILTTNFQQPALELDLPGGSADESQDERAVLIELTAGGELSVDGVAVGLDTLGQSLRAALGRLEAPVVRLRADERAPYGLVMPVIEAARGAGARTVDLVHDGRPR